MTNLHLPWPYTDELLYSVFARHFAYLQPSRPSYAYEAVTGARYFSIKYGRQLDNLAERTVSTWAMSSDEIVDRHTAFKYYGYFLSPQLHLDSFEALTKRTPRGAYLRLHSPSVTEAKYLRFCRSCMREDLAKVGETYWRRCHQLSGTMICTIHNEILADSKAVASSRSLQDATMFADAENSPDCAQLNENEQKMALKIAKRCHEMLLSEPSKWIFVAPPQVTYRRIAFNLGYRINRDKLNISKLVSDVILFYGDPFLKKLGFNLTVSAKPLRNIFRGEEVYHPLVHILVQLFLERQSEIGKLDFRSMVSPLPTLVYKCPNPYADHSNEFRPSNIELRKLPNGKYFRARCTCGYVFTFCSTLESDPTMPVVSRRVAYGKFFEEEAHRLYKQRPSFSYVAENMNISLQATKRMIRGEKGGHEPAAALIKSLRKEWTRAANKLGGARARSEKTYRTLLVWDREWLEAQMKRNKRKGRGNPLDKATVAKQDAAMAAKIHDAAKLLRDARPPQRVTLTKIGKQIGISTDFSRWLRKRPRCQSLVEEVSESLPCWLKRKREAMLAT